MKSKFKVLLLTSIIASSCISCTFAQAGKIIGGEDGRTMGMVMDSGVSLGNSIGRSIKGAISNRKSKAPKTSTTNLNTNTTKTVNLKDTTTNKIKK
ncbi:hypothetical protein [Leptotrichia massiliensis]|uniref:hypothetical protein n=1 Tax=Leptotrichia massiliensis TaxID=1852388 RepID=UPI0028D371AA|nr:hypothetical protein [Leptotrichia massiliensis]